METSKKPIKRLFNRCDVEQMSKHLPKDYLRNALHQYQNLLEYLRQLKQGYPEKARMLERNEKPGSKKAELMSDFKKDTEIFALYNVLKMTDAIGEEWNEFYYLLNARWLLKEADGYSTKAPTTTSDRQPMGAVLNVGPAFNTPTQQNIECRPPSQSYTQGVSIAGMSKGISDPQITHHGFPIESGRQKPEQPTKTEKSEIQQTIRPEKPEKQRTDGIASSPGMPQKITDLQKTFHKLPEESGGPKKGKSTGKPENQQTDSTPWENINAESEVGGPINQLLSRNASKESIKEAEQEYERLLRIQRALYNDRQPVQANVSWESSTDIGDITDEQKRVSPFLYGYLKKTFEKIKDTSQLDLVRKALSEFIILTVTSCGVAEKKKKADTAAVPNFPKRDVPSATVGDVNKRSKSEYANWKPIEKALKNLNMTFKHPSHLREAQHQYCYLIKRNDNFKRKFPDKHRELQVFMTDPEECAIASYNVLYNVLRLLQKTDPLYRDAWEEFFFLITSDQQFIIAESCGNLIKTVYKKEIDSMVIPRKSYDDLQNELVEKIKQIDELTSRLSKFASQQLTAGNPNIADLSDKHRPTKIGEFYSELYDNEWSEAFEVVKPLEYPDTTEDPDTEYFENVLRVLKNILMAAYEFSAERTEKHLKDIKLALLGTITDQEKDKAKGTEYDQFVTAHAMKYRKEAAAYAITTASEAFKRDGLQKFLKQKSEDPKLIAYVDKCVELTWYMRIQDPPMHLHCLQEKETISKTEFSYHGRKGKTTLVCVWPALLLLEGGPLVTKGHVLPEE